MSHDNASKTSKPIRFLFENSIFLIAGAVGALIWTNVDPDSYLRLVQFDLRSVFSDEQHESDGSHADAQHGIQPQPSANGGHQHTSVRDDGIAIHLAADTPPSSTDEHTEPGPSDEHEAVDDTEHGGHSHGWTLPFLINDILMALFFAIAGKEVWEALLPGGALSDPRKAATPLMATLGGIIGPAGLYVLGVLLFSFMGMTTWAELGRGWAVPCATDIAFSYLVARIIFGAGHPAIAFLLLLAIADDAAGLVILAIFYPTSTLALPWLGLSVGAVALGFVFHKVLRLQSFWWYLLIPGTMSWFSFFWAGIHPALGLVPVIITMPHARSDLGIFARAECGRDDTLNAFEHWWKNPVELILGLFGLVNAGVAMSSVGVGTWLVFGGLIIGKPLGITLFTWLGEKYFKLEMPAGMNYRHIVSLGMVAGIGFTVALFVSTAAFPVPPSSPAVLDSVKMGALASFFAAIVAYVGARLLGIRPGDIDNKVTRREDEGSEGDAAEVSISCPA